MVAYRQPPLAPSWPKRSRVIPVLRSRSRAWRRRGGRRRHGCAVHDLVHDGEEVANRPATNRTFQPRKTDLELGTRIPRGVSFANMAAIIESVSTEQGIDRVSRVPRLSRGKDEVPARRPLGDLDRQAHQLLCRAPVGTEAQRLDRRRSALAAQSGCKAASDARDEVAFRPANGFMIEQVQVTGGDAMAVAVLLDQARRGPLADTVEASRRARNRLIDDAV